MTGRACAAKCQGYLKTLDRYWDLIVAKVIKSDEALDAWNEMNEQNEARVIEFGETYVDPLDD